MDKNLYKERIKKIFHSDIFIELMKFWKMVEESKYDYKIFVSKKCFVLYKVFRPLFDFESYEDCEKITDTAIPIYIDKLNNAKVLVVDDVFIHGRATSKIQREIGGIVGEIVYYTFAKNYDFENPQDTSTRKMQQKESAKLSLSEQIYRYSSYIQKENVKGYIHCKEYQWKRISDLIMKSLWGVNMPYTSYLPIFKINESALANTIVEKNAISYSSYSQQYLDQKFSYYIQTNNMKNSIIHYCFIISKNGFMGDCKITPMVFFDCEHTSIDKKFIFKSLEIIFGEKIKELKRIFIKKNSSQGLVSIFEFLIFCVSYLATIRCFKLNGIKEKDYTVDFENANYSFGGDIEKYLFILKNVNAIDLLEQIEKCTIKSLPDEMRKQADLRIRTELMEGLKKAYMDMQTYDTEEFPYIINVLSRYFKFNNIYREENIYKHKMFSDGSVSGLMFSDIKEFLKSKDFTNEDVIFGLMCRYNQGAATIDYLYDYDKRNRLVGINMYWRAGEQSYKCISQTYVLIVYFQNLYADLFGEKVSEFLYKRLVEYAALNYDYYGIPFSKEDLEYYCSKRDNVYNAVDIRRYCEREQYKYLGYIAKQMEQYVLRGYLLEINENDTVQFKENLFNYMKKHSDDTILYNCKNILWSKKE